MAPKLANRYPSGMTSKEARAKNLALLVKTKTPKGTQAAFATDFGFDAAHVSQMINYKTMGDSVARKIERLFKLHQGAMDAPLAEEPPAPDLGGHGGNTSDSYHELDKLWPMLPESMQAAILQMARASAESVGVAATKAMDTMKGRRQTDKSQ